MPPVRRNQRKQRVYKSRLTFKNPFMTAGTRQTKQLYKTYKNPIFNGTMDAGQIQNQKAVKEQIKLMQEKGLLPKNLAKKLLNDHVVTRTPLTGDVFSYCCKNTGASIDSTPFIPVAKGKTTKDMSFMTGSDLRSTIDLTGALKARYVLSYATLSDIDSELKKVNNPEDTGNRLYAIATIARDDSERATIQKKIKGFYEANPKSAVVVIDASNTILGEVAYNEFLDNYATSLAI